MKRKKNANRRTPGFTEDEMKRAVLEVVNDCVPINRVARDNGLCKKTLKSYVDKYLSLSGRKKKLIRFKPNYEINQVFTNDLERLFEESLLAAHLAQQKITRDYIREAAFEFATNCNVHVPKTWNVRKKSGLDWMYGYLNRHPVIKNIVASYRRPRYTDLIRAHGGLVGGVTDDIANVRIEIETDDSAAVAAADPLSGEVVADSPDELDAMADEYFYSYLKVQNGADGEPPPDDGSCLSGISVKTPIDEFRENLTAAYNVIAIDSCVPSERVYNLGEIALIVENPSRGSLTGREIVVTACCLVNATGDALPPFFVFPCARFRPSMLRGLPAGVDGTARRGGLVDADVFLLLLEHFQELTKAGSRHKVALIMDDDEYHVTIGSLDFCAKHSIELVTLPPHYARQLQPIGRYAFRTLKAYFNRACQRFRTAHPDVVVSMYDVVALFCQIWPIAFTSDNVVDGFTKTGIYPLDDELLSKGDFLQTEPRPDRAESPITCDLDIELQPAGVADSESSNDDENLVAASSPGQGSATPVEPPVSAGSRKIAPLTDKSAIEEFFDQLVNAYGALHRHGGLASEKVYNLDELELAVCIPTDEEAEMQRLRITAGCCVNAAGVALPSFFVYPRDHFHAAVLKGAGSGVRGTATADGASNAAVFALMLRHFQQQVQASSDNRVLLLVDCEEHHVTLEAIAFCQQHGIELVTAPPHIAEPLQPLEKVFAAFETHFRADCERFADEGRCVTPNDLAALFAGAAERSFTALNIVTGFESTGLWPLNKELFARDTLCLPYTEAPEQRISVADKKIGGRTQSKEYLLTDSDDGSVSSGDDDDIVEFYSKLDVCVDALADHHRTAAAIDARIFVLGEFADSANETCISAYLFVNAAGQSLPPFLVYPRHLRGRPQLYSGALAAAATADGAPDQTAYLRSLRHFQQHAAAMTANKTLLLVEGAPAHLCDEAAAFYRDHGITSLTFPGRDATLFSPLQEPLLWPLRARFEEACGRSGPDGVDELAAVFERTWNKTLSPSKIAATFKLFGFCAPKSLEAKPPPEGARSSEVEVVDDYDSFIIEEEIEVVMPPPVEEVAVMAPPLPRFACRQCDIEFESADHLWIHERTHQQSVIAQLSRCRYCDRACNTFAERDRHEGTHMKGDRHCCAFCDKECTSRAALVQHRRKHQKQTS